MFMVSFIVQSKDLSQGGQTLALLISFWHCLEIHCKCSRTDYGPHWEKQKNPKTTTKMHAYNRTCSYI